MPVSDCSGRITRLLRAWSCGDQAAFESLAPAQTMRRILADRARARVTSMSLVEDLQILIVDREPGGSMVTGILVMDGANAADQLFRLRVPVNLS
jgi:hypothetical protein